MKTRRKLAVTKRIRKIKKQVRKIALRRQMQFSEVMVSAES